ncbi:Solute carrier family 35 member G1 [Chlorella sorokiniana]|uniref:Solute carrier family 35 member G1 n=1 Tax=Chlorella sorokiniana TaxID=3076 RepID=A0A2P6TF32_CHLSO|nr:Solute carrier family 35 member G1 [Chlorella sorokiniana]|eukprot:PRW32584.1 Solute carrier family 35 member G1 [Chlorella sorokiniana]
MAAVAGRNPLHEPLLAAYDADGALGVPAPPRPPAAPLLPPPSGAGAAAELPSVEVDPEAGEYDHAAKAARAAHRRELRGLGLNALSTLFGTGMSLFAKISGSQGIGVFEIVLTRSLILVLFTAPELIFYRVNPFRDHNRRWLLVLRGVLGFASVSSLYLAVALLPLADASVLSFLSPIFVAMLSPVILKEKPSKGTLLGIPVAMVGVVLVARPSFIFRGGGGISGIGVLVGIAQALFNSLSRMTVRALSLNSSERMSSIIFGQGAISSVGAAIMCGVWRHRFVLPTQFPVAGALLAGGLLGYAYQLALTGGLQRARAAPAVAMSYLSVIWSILADILLFHDLPPVLSLVGAGIICLSSFFVAFSQKKLSTSKTAGARWERSVARLDRAAGTADEEEEEEEEEAALADDVGAAPHLRAPLLGGQRSLGGLRKSGAALGSRGSAAVSASGESAEEWASAREGSNASMAFAEGEWWDAASAGEGGAAGGLKAQVKEAAAAAVAAAAAAEVEQPDTPAAPPALPIAAHAPHSDADGAPSLLGAEMAELEAAELWALSGMKASAAPKSIAPEDSTCAAEGSGSSASTPSLNSLSQQSSLSLDLQPAPASKRDAKAINARVMQSQSVQDLFDLVSTNLQHLDSINTTAALQRLAKLLSWEDASRGGGGDSSSQKAAALSSPVFGMLTGLMVAQCAAGFFNSQSTANAWWAVAKLHSPEHPASIELVVALEGALVGCLTAPREFDRPNAQACSATWWSWGRIATLGPDGYVPSPTAAELLWDRTQRLSLAFDSQGVANMLWAWGLLAKRHSAVFPLRTDVLTGMAFVVARLSSSFAVQGLSCAVVGCANMGPAYRASVAPIVHLLIAQSLQRITSFNMQAMANMASAFSRMGTDMLSASRTRLVLAAFDAHAVALPPTYKQQEALSLATALRASGISQPRFNPNPHTGPAAAFQLPPPPPRPSAPAGQQSRLPEAACLRDSTNQPNRSPTGAPGLSAAGSLPPWMAVCAVPLALQLVQLQQRFGSVLPASAGTSS